MIVYTGKAAEDLNRKYKQYCGNRNGVYDYEIRDGICLVRIKDNECIYLKSRIAIQGTPDEIEEFADAAWQISSGEIKELAEWARSIH